LATKSRGHKTYRPQNVSATKPIGYIMYRLQKVWLHNISATIRIEHKT
jgi:hypothetical protein